jgi:hypothetical protein
MKRRGKIARSTRIGTRTAMNSPIRRTVSTRTGTAGKSGRGLRHDDIVLIGNGFLGTAPPPAARGPRAAGSPLGDPMPDTPELCPAGCAACGNVVS